MATAPLRPISVAKTVHGNSPWTQSFPEAASQTYKTGAVLTLDANGRIAEAGTNPVRILGVAAGDANNDTVAGTHNNLVWIADDETIFRGNISTASTPNTSAITDVGAGLAITKDTAAPGGDTWELVKPADPTNRRVIVVDLDPQDAVGAVNGRLLFMFFSQFRILDYTS